MWHPGLKSVAARTRVSPGKHRCEGCGSITHYKSMRYDHIDPAVELSGFRDFGTYARRLLDAVPEGIQHLCEGCHAYKTAHERELRVAMRRQRKLGEAS